MTKDTDDFLKKMFSEETQEEKEALRKKNYLNAQQNPENMSYWFPKIDASTTNKDSILRIPKTHVVQIPYDWWIWLRSDNYVDEMIKKFNDWLLEQTKNFQEGNTMFMKTGVFSDKFYFKRTIIHPETSIARHFLDMYYNSMIVGASETAEVVLREFIFDKENRPTIYTGMPLHTEFRVFYDFDKKEVVGISNYWHPDYMTDGLYDEVDKLVYKNWNNVLVDEFDKYKQFVAKEVSACLKGVDSLTGKWSVDVMKNAKEFWLIDMARMERSALIQQMELLEES